MNVRHERFNKKIAKKNKIKETRFEKKLMNKFFDLSNHLIVDSKNLSSNIL